MLRLALPLLLVCCAGCQHAPVIDRDTLDRLYADTALRPGVLSAVPIVVDAQTPPTVVNWWYAGSRGGQHVLVFRELTWDESGRPVGREARYRTPVAGLPVVEAFDYVDNERRWQALYEASPAIPPPADLPTRRQRPGTTGPAPIDPVPIDREPPSALER